MISLREDPQSVEPLVQKKGKKLRYLIILGLFLDVILIIVFSLWLFYSKSTSEFEMLAEERSKVEKDNLALLAKLEELEKGGDIEYSSDVVLSISNMVLNKLSQNLFPLEFALKGSVSGIIKGEELGHFQFVEQGRLLFRIKLVARNLKYNPRGKSRIDRMLGGTTLQKKVILNGTGEIRFSFNEKKQRLDLRYDITGIDFKTGFPQYLEKEIKDRVSKVLRDKPNYTEFNFKPLKVKLGNKVAVGNYHIKNVITKANRLMAIAELVFENTKEEK